MMIRGAAATSRSGTGPGIVLAGLALVAVTSTAAAGYFHGLGDLPGGGYYSTAWGVSDDGSVVTGTSKSVLSVLGEAYRWTAETGMVPLGCLPGEHPVSYARGISGDGSVVVGESYTVWLPGAGQGWQAFRWTEATGVVGLGPRPGVPLGPASEAQGTSSDGSVVVGMFWDTAVGTGRQAFRWTEAGDMTLIGDLEGSGTKSYAYAVSADGMVVVGYGTGDSGHEAMRWTPLGGMVGLGDLPGWDFHSTAYAVSPDGSAVVGTASGASGPEAFRWTRESGMVGLGDLPGGLSYSYGYGVSAGGTVVVGQSGVLGGSQAFIWTPANGMQSLQDVLTQQYKVNLAGWTLETARAVTPDGRVIVGYGRNPYGQTEAWRVDLRPLRVKLWGALVNLSYDRNGFALHNTQGMGSNAVACDATVALEDFALEQGSDFALVKWFYDEDEIADKKILESSLRIYWLDEGLEVPGATEALWYPGGTNPDGGCGPGLDVGETPPDPNLFGVGCYGINTAEKYVWANISHDSVYGIGGILDPAMIGDTNGDGVIDRLDYDNLIDQFGGAPGADDADFNDDGLVDIADFAIQRAYYRYGAASAPHGEFGATTPEPATATLLVLVGLAILRRRRERGTLLCGRAGLRPANSTVP